MKDVLDDLTGQQFGKWTVIKRAEDKVSKNGKKRTMWHCKCECGTERDIFPGNLKRGLTTNCGCERIGKHPTNFIDLTGQKFGRLTVIELAETKNWNVYWKCKCECGNYTTVLSSKLRVERTQSCGCIRKEIIIQRSEKHGLRHKRIYNIYCTMKARCYNSNSEEYHNYGGRGIVICKEWLGENGIENFAKWAYENGYNESADFGQCTIDRIDVNGNYEPSNCRWTTNKEQMRNLRSTIYLTYHGETKSLCEWSEITGISRGTLYGRKKKFGYTDEECIDVPIGRRRGKRKGGA